MPSSLQNVPMSNNGAVGSDIEEKLSNLSVEKASYPSEMFRKERASFKLNKSSKGKIIKHRSKYFRLFLPPFCGVVYLFYLLMPAGQVGYKLFQSNFRPTGKLQKDRRKMREKRRSTGVVYLGCQGNDSNGTTTGEEEEEEEVVVVDEETVKNTKQNEICNTSTTSPADTEGN